MFCSSFRTNWQHCKEDGKDYSFDVLCDLLIRYQHKPLDEGNIGGKQQAHLMKGKGNKIYMDRTYTDGFGPRQECLDHKSKLNT